MEKHAPDELAIASDVSPIPARHAMVRPHEWPVFDMDESGRPFAIACDVDDLSTPDRTRDVPLTLEEVAPT